MLRQEVIDAVAEGQFHIYPIESVDAGMEILTGLPAGELQPDGSFSEGSVHRHVQRRLEEMAEIVRRHRDRS